jgi:hypothetical protein
MKKGRYIDAETRQITWTMCPECGENIRTEYGSDLPDSDEIKCKKCKKTYQVDYWDEENDDPIEPENGGDLPW